MNKAGIYCMLAATLVFLVAVGCLFNQRYTSRILTENYNDLDPSDPSTTVTNASNVITNSKLNINLATAENLEMLPGIGEALAQRIVEFRTNNGPFKTVSELLEVKGIGPVKLEALRAYITVG